MATKTMVSEPDTWCIIPARGNSERIKDKNIVPFLGKPIIEYPIKAALNSGVFDRVIVSTDSQEIEDLARKAGALVYRRNQPTGPAVPLAQSVRETLVHSYGDMPVYFAVLPSTAVMTDLHRIRDSYICMSGDTDADGFCYVVEGERPAEYALEFCDGDTGYIERKYKESVLYNSQQFKPTYYPANNIVWYKMNAYLKSWPHWPPRMRARVIKAELDQDVHTVADLNILQRKYSLWETGRRRN